MKEIKQVVDKLKVLTEDGKTVWFKFLFAPDLYWYRCRYNGVIYCVRPIEHSSLVKSLWVNLTDVSGHKYTQGQKDFDLSDKEASDLITAIRATNPEEKDAVHHGLDEKYEIDFIDGILNTLEG